MTTLSNQQIQFEQALANLLALYGDVGSDTVTSPVLLSLINLTKVKLDEIIPEGEGLQFKIDGDINITDPLNMLIASIMPEATKRVLMSCPIHYLLPVKSDIVTGTQEATDSKIGFIPLPDNFMRFVSLKMADWKRQVNHILYPQIDIEAYSMQQNQFVRGGTSKPVIAFSTRTVSSAQKKVIEYYSINTSHNIDWLYYIQETDAADLQVNLRDALTWQAAAMILQITERVDLAKVAIEQVQLCYNNL